MGNCYIEGVKYMEAKKGDDPIQWCKGNVEKNFDLGLVRARPFEGLSWMILLC